MSDLGPLAAALAKAQVAFPAVVKDKKVTVTTLKGGSYSFTYAPLDSILNAVRKPLADNGLVIVQMLDDGDLVTSLFHESGGAISGRVALPVADDIKAFGSAITYLRRYAIQAALGIAAEDDDDGSRHAGDELSYDPNRETKQVGTETLELLGRVDVNGTAKPGGSDAYKGEWRETPEGWVIGFKLTRAKNDPDMPQVLIVGDISTALMLADQNSEFIGKHVRVKGRLYAVKQPGRTTYNRLVVGEAVQDFIETADLRIPAKDEPAEEAAPVAPGQEEAFDLSAEALV